jgi:phospholipase D1/2
MQVAWYLCMPVKTVRRVIHAVGRRRPLPGSEFSWRFVILLAGIVGVFLIALTLWHASGSATLPNLRDVSAWMAPHRRAWYALPLVVAIFTIFGLVLVPVLLMIAATGLAFGPWLGPLYAMAGSLSSASVGFAIGRTLGRRRVERIGGRRVARINLALERNGTLAVFFLRKVPAPFMVANIVIGASRVRYRDFVVGTLLGMAALVVALAGFGYQISSAVHDPTPTKLAIAAACLGLPLTVAWLVNKWVQRTHASTRADSRP